MSLNTIQRFFKSIDGQGRNFLRNWLLDEQASSPDATQRNQLKLVQARLEYYLGTAPGDLHRIALLRDIFLDVKYAFARSNGADAGVNIVGGGSIILPHSGGAIIGNGIQNGTNLFSNTPDGVQCEFTGDCYCVAIGLLRHISGGAHNTFNIRLQRRNAPTDAWEPFGPAAVTWMDRNLGATRDSYHAAFTSNCVPGTQFTVAKTQLAGSGVVSPSADNRLLVFAFQEPPPIALPV